MSSLLSVADSVIVTSKHNDDVQHIWESDSNSFTVAEDPRGNTLERGTTVSLHMKEEAQEFLEQSKIRELVKRYSQFINFDIYLWDSKVCHASAWLVLLSFTAADSRSLMLISVLIHCSYTCTYMYTHV